MADVTRLLDAAAAGDSKAAADLLPLVYDELRRLAAALLAREKPGQTVQATALVHDAYVRLVGPDQGRDWNGRGHFFAAAAEAMRRILVEAARRKKRKKHGGELAQIELPDVPARDPDLVRLDGYRRCNPNRPSRHNARGPHQSTNRSPIQRGLRQMARPARV